MRERTRSATWALQPVECLYVQYLKRAQRMYTLGYYSHQMLRMSVDGRPQGQGIQPEPWHARKLMRKRHSASTTPGYLLIRRQGKRHGGLGRKSIRSSPTLAAALSQYGNLDDDLFSIRHLPRPHTSFGTTGGIGPSEMTLIVVATCLSISATQTTANVYLLHPGRHSPPPSWIHSSNCRTMGHPPSFAWRLMSAHRSVPSPIPSWIPARSP